MATCQSHFPILSSKFSCEVRKISWQDVVMLAGILKPCSSKVNKAKVIKEKLTRKAEVVFAWLSEVSDLEDADLRIQTD